MRFSDIHSTPLYHFGIMCFLQVLAPVLATPVESEEACLLYHLLNTSGDILAALCSQSAWHELHTDIALAALSAISITSVSDPSCICAMWAARAIPAATSCILSGQCFWHVERWQ